MLLLCLLSYANLWLRNSSIFISFISHFVRNVADSMVHTYAVKVSLVYLFACAGASSFENDPRFLAVCDDSSMQLNVDFASPFHGLIYTSGDAFVPECSFPTSPRLNNTKLMLTLPFLTCSFDVSTIDEYRISITSTIVVQQHRMMATSYDILQNVTCELSLPMDTFRQWYYPNATLTAGHLYTGLWSVPDVSTWIETRIGSDLFPDDGSEIGTELFFVIKVRDGGKNKDMSVQNCIAHDNKVLTNDTLLYHMSDVFGCPNTSYVLSNFTVSNQTEGRANLMSYTQMGDLAYTVKGEFFVTCGVVLCENVCPNMCEANASWSSHYLSDIVVKRFAGRLTGATLPPSLNLFENRQRISKRSFRKILSRWFSFGSTNAEVNSIFEEGLVRELTTLGEILENSTNVFYATGISTDLDVHPLSDNPLSRLMMTLGNRTNQMPDYKSANFNIWPEFTVCIVFIFFIFFVGTYAGFLSANAKREEKNLVLVPTS